MQTQVTVSASQFKTHCLEYLEDTKTHGTKYIVTKRGVPVAGLGPITESKNFSFGKMKGTLVIKGDIMAPLEVEWSK